jgi:hypothetical protein
MKKTTPKSAVSPAPAKKTAAKPIAKPTSKTVAAAPVAPPVVKPAAKKKKTPPAAPAVKPGTPAPVLTVITAHIDIGFGNALHLRGEGPGLSWHQGLPMQCVADDEWAITLPESAQPVVFKFLVNDLTWSTGPDYVAAPGTAITLKPVF